MSGWRQGVERSASARNAFLFASIIALCVGAHAIPAVAQITDRFEPKRRFELVPGSTLRETLERWAADSGWHVRWASDRAYPVRGRATFEGDFVAASSDLIRSFRALDPPPIGRFYLRNRQLRVVTQGDEMGE